MNPLYHGVHAVGAVGELLRNGHLHVLLVLVVRRQGDAQRGEELLVVQAHVQLESSSSYFSDVKSSIQALSSTLVSSYFSFKS